MRGQRLKREAEKESAGAQGEPTDVETIDVSGFTPRRRTSRKWRELIQKVWEADPLLCPNCQHEMRIIALIDEEEVIERILRHLGLWEEPVDVCRGPPESILGLEAAIAEKKKQLALLRAARAAERALRVKKNPPLRAGEKLGVAAQSRSLRQMQQTLTKLKRTYLLEHQQYNQHHHDHHRTQPQIQHRTGQLL